jgi:beta-xylosidase
MEALAEFKVTLTFCFTPEHRGLAPHHTSPPLDPQEFAAFCARMVARYCDLPATVGSASPQFEPAKDEICAP